MIGAKIRAKRKSLGLSQEELAERAGVHHNTIARWERGELDPRGTSLAKLAKGLQVTPAELLSGETDNPKRASCSEKPNSSPEQPESNAWPVKMVKIPMIGGVIRACCGKGNAYASDVEWEVDGFSYIPASELDAYAWQVGDGGFHTIRVEGNSMEPRIHDGDTLLFGDLPVSNGNFAVVRYDDRLIVRGVWDHHNGHYTLKALNSAYDDIDVDMEDESKDFYILGKVIRRITVENLADGMM